jgi:hypothetical protein
MPFDSADASKSTNTALLRSPSGAVAADPHRAAPAGGRTRRVPTRCGARSIPFRWLAARSAQPAAHRLRRDRGAVDQRRIRSADRLSRRPAAAPQPRAVAASNYARKVSRNIPIYQTGQLTRHALRNRWSADSPVEGGGFELSVPPGKATARAGTAARNQYGEPRTAVPFTAGSTDPMGRAARKWQLRRCI